MSTNLFRHPTSLPSLVGKHADHISCLDTKYNIEYKIVGLGSLRDTFCRYAEVNHDLNTQL